MEAKFGSSFIGEVSKTYQQCFYSLVVYPSDEFKETFDSKETAVVTGLIAVVFFITGLFFFVFVWFVARRQNKVMAIAQRTLKIVSSLFPEKVRDQLLKEAEEQANREATGMNTSETDNLKHILDEGYSGGTGAPFTSNNAVGPSSRPIAELYPECTVMVSIEYCGFVYS